MSSIEITINTGQWDKNSPELTRAAQALPERIAEGGSDIVYQELGLTIPVKTGNLKNSRIREVHGNTGSVIVTADYARYVNDGTGPSPGRYVPAIGKRIRTGMHPGIKGQHYAEIAAQNAYSRIQTFVQDLLKELFG